MDTVGDLNVMLIGSGGREHALAWKLLQSARVNGVYPVPGNEALAHLCGGTTEVSSLDFPSIRSLIQMDEIGLVVVGPEEPLAAGIVDALADTGCPVFGPTAAAARLESSKAFAKQFMQRHNIPTAAYAEFDDAGAAKEYVRAQGSPIVIKADGLAAGKGVTVALDVDQALAAIDAAMLDKQFGEAGARILVEEFLQGEEASILAFADGMTILPMASSQDHKRAYDNDEGPNTGGMGAYSPAPIVTPELQQRINAEILEPTIRGMAAEGNPYIGCLYAGLMITRDGPKVIEYNCRFGDPETQVVLPRMKSDLAEVMLACCNGTLSDTSLEFDDGACVTVVLASGGYPGAYEKGKVITGLREAEEEGGVMVFRAGTSDDGRILTNGGRVLNVTAQAKDIPAAIAKAYRAVEKIHFKDMHYRKDIGQRALRHSLSKKTPTPTD